MDNYYIETSKKLSIQMSRYKGVLKHLKTISARKECPDVNGTAFWRDYPFNPNDNGQDKKVSQSQSLNALDLSFLTGVSRSPFLLGLKTHLTADSEILITVEYNQDFSIKNTIVNTQLAGTVLKTKAPYRYYCNFYRTYKYFIKPI